MFLLAQYDCSGSGNLFSNMHCSKHDANCWTFHIALAYQQKHCHGGLQRGQYCFIECCLIHNMKRNHIDRSRWMKWLITRAVQYFRLFQKTVILPPNPVGFRLTYTQLWDIYFSPICINLLELNTKVFIFQSYKGFVVLISLFPFIIFENVTEQ